MPGTMTPFRFRMAGILWQRGIGGRYGMIHNEAFKLTENPTGFRWTLTNRHTGAVWQGATLRGLVDQIYLDLHCAQFDVDSLIQTDGPGEWCGVCLTETEAGR